MKRCSPLFATREMQIKTARRYHYMYISMAIIKRIPCWRGYGATVEDAQWCNRFVK